MMHDSLHDKEPEYEGEDEEEEDDIDEAPMNIPFYPPNEFGCTESQRPSPLPWPETIGSDFTSPYSDITSVICKTLTVVSSGTGCFVQVSSSVLDETAHVLELWRKNSVHAEHTTAVLCQLGIVPQTWFLDHVSNLHWLDPALHKALDLYGLWSWTLTLRSIARLMAALKMECIARQATYDEKGAMAQVGPHQIWAPLTLNPPTPAQTARTSEAGQRPRGDEGRSQGGIGSQEQQHLDPVATDISVVSQVPLDLAADSAEHDPSVEENVHQVSFHGDDVGSTGEDKNLHFSSNAAADLASSHVIHPGTEEPDPSPLDALERMTVEERVVFGSDLSFKPLLPWGDERPENDARGSGSAVNDEELLGVLRMISSRDQATNQNIFTKRPKGIQQIRTLGVEPESAPKHMCPRIPVYGTRWQGVPEVLDLTRVQHPAKPFPGGHNLVPEIPLAAAVARGSSTTFRKSAAGSVKTAHQMPLSPMGDDEQADARAIAQGDSKQGDTGRGARKLDVISSTQGGMFLRWGTRDEGRVLALGLDMFNPVFGVVCQLLDLFHDLDDFGRVFG
ncbi:hypothetical protein C8R44DRAFT_739075 [Mycena epipterygia]|nr:hypothetical protein C8R44DRAFT_739075 [Mycena epipterygia]